MLTGIWPILHLKSFDAVTGPKVDRWLVKTTGGLIAAVGASLTVAAFDATDRGGYPGTLSRPVRRSSWSARAIRVLGIGSALSLALVDVVYVGKGRIARVYLADVLAEAGLVAGWLFE